MEYMRCPTCGHTISEYWEAFIYMTQVLVESKPEEDDGTRFIDPDLNESRIKVFEALRIDKYCTRTRFTCARHIHNF